MSVPERVLPRLPRAGFTLIELIVALAIAASLLAVAPAALSRMFDAMQYRSLVRDVLADLRATRNHAMLTGSETRFEIDLPARRLSAVSRNREVPESIELDAVLARRESDGAGRGAIVFYPDGSSTGGSIRIQRDNGQGVVLRVDWMLGRVTQEALDGPG